MSGQVVVVWEWENKQGRWRPYSPEVTQLLERAYHKQLTKVMLKDADPALAEYYITLSKMEQYTEGTGQRYRVRRQFYPHQSPAGKGAKWEWAGHVPGEWHVYDMDVQSVIEDSWAKGSQTIDISKKFPSTPYIINFCNLTQVRNNTGFVRSIRRVQQATYPIVKVKNQEHAGAAVQDPMAPQLDGIFAQCSKYIPDPPSSDDCLICLSKLNEASGYSSTGAENTVVVALNRCNHMFHLACVKMMKNTNKTSYLECPMCKTIYGEKHGNQPDGHMTCVTLQKSLPGHPDCGTIQITYSFQPGIQGPRHPNPGCPYYPVGFPRICYLPDSEKGRKVLKLLKVAFNRRLIFTIGQSVTTGMSDVLVWNEIHHKTNQVGHSYPDPNYLDNVLMELAVQGVV